MASVAPILTTQVVFIKLLTFNGLVGDATNEPKRGPRTDTVAKRLPGTMITYGYPRLSLASELDLAERFGVDVLEILPDWASLPDPGRCERRWPTGGWPSTAPTAAGEGRSIRADRVDLGDTDPSSSASRSTT